MVPTHTHTQTEEEEVMPGKVGVVGVTKPSQTEHSEEMSHIPHCSYHTHILIQRPVLPLYCVPIMQTEDQLGHETQTLKKTPKNLKTICFTNVT